jgi:hypothetical protein
MGYSIVICDNATNKSVRSWQAFSQEEMDNAVHAAESILAHNQHIRIYPI